MTPEDKIIAEADAETIETLKAENAALKAELKAINAALDDPRTDLTMTACEVISTLKEQVAQLKAESAKWKEACRKEYLSAIDWAGKTQAAEIDKDNLQSKSAALVDALERMNRAYVNLMENGRDRIVSLGGECDAVDVMERGDIYLRESRAALAAFKGEK